MSRDVVGTLGERRHSQLSAFEQRQQLRMKSARGGERRRAVGDDTHVGDRWFAFLPQRLAPLEDRRQLCLELAWEPLNLLEVQGAMGRQLHEAQAPVEPGVRLRGGCRLAENLRGAFRREHRAVHVDEGLPAAGRFVVDRAGGRLVASALRSRQQQDIRVRRVSCHRFPQRADHGAVAEQRAFHPAPRIHQQFLRDAQLARELRVPGLELPPQPLEGEVRVDPRDHLLTLKGLGDEVDRADFEAPDLVLGLVEGRQEDHRRLARLGIRLEAPARLVSVDPGHHDVEQHQQRTNSPRHLDRTLAAARHEQPVAAAVQRVAQHVEIRHVVVDEEDPIGIIGRRS